MTELTEEEIKNNDDDEWTKWGCLCECEVCDNGECNCELECCYNHH